MPPVKAALDNFAQRVHASTLELVDGGGSCEAFTTTYNAKDKIALVIHKYEAIFAGASIEQLTSNLQYIEFGLALWDISGGSASYDITRAGVIHYKRLGLADNGVAIHPFLLDQPYVSDFTSLPGGGLVAHPYSLWAFHHGVNIGAAVTTVHHMIHYTVMTISAEFYQELFAMQIINAISV